MPDSSCYHCGYSLVGLLDAHRRGTCPECGQAHEPRPDEASPQDPEPLRPSLRWILPLVLVAITTGVVVFITIVSAIAEPGAALMNAILIPLFGLLVWCVTWIVWATADPKDMRKHPWQTSLVGGLIGLAAGTITVVLQAICVAIMTMFINS